MRVIGGTARGRPLKALAGRALRPTADRVREAIFDLVGPAGPGRTVLDLFAGTGALGIEALSRGAERAVFVDSDRRGCELVAANLQACGFTGQARIERRDALRFLTRPVPDAPFDLVLLDPPYQQGLLPACLAALGAPGLLSGAARVFCEAEAGLWLEPIQGGLVQGRVKRYGDTAVFEYLPGGS